MSYSLGEYDSLTAATDDDADMGTGLALFGGGGGNILGSLVSGLASDVTLNINNGKVSLGSKAQAAAAQAMYEAEEARYNAEDDDAALKTLAGAAAGAAVGSAVPALGTSIGAIIGAFIGYRAGAR